MGRNVAIYARVSTEHEAQLSALENQVQYYDDILSKHPDWVLYDRYIDEGITGTSVKKRKNFMRMLEDAENGCFDLIVTREVSRFARNTVDTLQETRKLKKQGVEVYFVEDNIWTMNDEDGELKLTIMATLAQNESKKISQRVKAGQHITFLNGVYYGNGNILGYDKVGKDLIVNEKQAEIVRLIFQMCLDGKGTTDIKFELEKRGYLTSTGKRIWHASYIVRILHNPFYCGTLVYRKSYIPDYLEQKAKINRGEVEQVIVEGKHEPLISKEDFNKVQKILESHATNTQNKREKNKGVGTPKNIWSKKLVCECGASFNKRRYHKATETKPESYGFQCYNQKNNGSFKQRQKRGLDTTGACDIPMVPEWKLKVMYDAVFNSIFENKEEIIKITNKIIEETIKDEQFRTDLLEEIEKYKSKIEKINEKNTLLLDTYLNGLIDKEVFTNKKEQYKIDVENYNNKIYDLKLKLGVPENELKERLENLKKKLREFTINKDELVDELSIDTFIEKVEVHKEHFIWKLNFIDNIIKLEVANNKSSSVDLLMDKDNLTAEVNGSTSCNQSKTR